MPTRVLLALTVVLLSATALCGQQTAGVIWWEGEDAVDTNFREHSWLEMDAKGREWLSGGDWLTHMHKDDSPAPEGGRYFARYPVRVRDTSRYHLWVRERPKRAPLLSRWHFDDQPWRETSTDLPWTDRVIAARDRPAVWYRYGVVELDAGEHTFEMELPPVPGSASFDCFLLYRGKLEPSGKRRPASEPPEFYEYPENQRVEVIVQQAREKAETIQRLREHVAASEVNRVDFAKIGREVDVARFGTDYADEFQAHDGKTNSQPRETKTVFARGGFIEWTLTAPRAGEYVLTIGADIARLPDRRGKISIQFGGAWQDYGEIAESGQYHCLVTLPQGETCFRLDNVGGRPFYTSGARISEIRGDPWVGYKPGRHPRLQFTPDEIAEVQRRISADPDHPVRYYYDGLLGAADKQVTEPSSLSSPRGSAQALHEVAIAYALTGKKQYGDRAAEYLDRLSQRDFGRNPGSVLGNGEYLDCMAWGYDVLYPRLTEAQRRAVRERLDTEAHWLWVEARTLCKDTSYGWWSSDHSNNWQAVAGGGLGMAALALLGESSDAEVWHDDTLPVENPDTSPRLALARCWPEHGRVALRTGWSDPNAILFAMECGEYGSHGHADQGGFVLTAYGEHLVDDTGYGGWEATSEAHSVVLIDGEGQRRSGMLGAIRDFLHTEAMDYFEADSTPAYPNARRVKRHVLFVRPSYFVIVDDVRKDDAPHDYQWLLHSTVQLSTTEITVRQPDDISFDAERASLAVRIISPDTPLSEIVRKQSHQLLTVATPQKVDEATFFAVLYPTPAGSTPPAVARIRTDALVGAEVGEDLALWSRQGGEWDHAGIKTDARFAACCQEPASVFVKSARSVQWGRLGLVADRPVTAILRESEARLVLPESTTLAFAGGYMSGASVYETDQDRDTTNDRRVGQVDEGGRISLPPGSFTAR